MAALVAADVTITLDNERGRENSRQKTNEVTIAFGDAVDTYPSGGVPMPTFTNWGFIRNLDDIMITDNSSATGLICKWDKANQKIRIYEQGLRTGSTTAAASGNGALAEGGVDGATETAIRLANSAIDVTYQLGALKELTATSKVAAISLKARAYGW